MAGLIWILVVGAAALVVIVVIAELLARALRFVWGGSKQGQPTSGDRPKRESTSVIVFHAGFIAYGSYVLLQIYGWNRPVSLGAAILLAAAIGAARYKSASR